MFCSLSLSINNLIICQLIGLLKIYIYIVYLAVHCHSIICTARPQTQQVSSLIYVHTRKGVGGRKEALWEGQKLERDGRRVGVTVHYKFKCSYPAPHR